jgi:bifunctional DNA-binding transcriptional regulator/antitoxin component of YhaV-PrlF toxin-antitoxin module
MMEKELLKKETSLKMSESRIGKITAKRQITIPKDYYDKLGFVEDNVEIILDNNELRIRKYKKIEESHDDYADLILKSILDEGIQNKDEILKEFRRCT